MKLLLNDAEVRDIKALLSELAGRYDSTDDPSVLGEASVCAHELPSRVRRHFTKFRLS